MFYKNGFFFLNKKIKKISSCLFFILLISVSACLASLFSNIETVYGDVEYPEYSSYVNDYVSLLDPDWKNKIEDLCFEVEQATGAQIAVAIVPTIQGITQEEYAVGLFEKWGIGEAKGDNGVLLLISPEGEPGNRPLRIEVGYGLEGAITDLEAKEIVDEIITPRLKAGDFNGGVYEGVAAIANKIFEEYSYTTTIETEQAASSFGFTDFFRGMQGNPFFFCCIPVFLIISIITGIKSIFRRKCPKCRKIKLKIKTTVIQQATYTTTGKMLEERDCTYIYPTGIACGYHDQRTVTIPKKTRSSGGGFVGGFGGSSGGGGGGFGGFGGGSSGGGGASGGW